MSIFAFNTLSFANWAKLFIYYKFALTSNKENIHNFAHNYFIAKALETAASNLVNLVIFATKASPLPPGGT